MHHAGLSGVLVKRYITECMYCIVRESRLWLCRKLTNKRKAKEIIEKPLVGCSLWFRVSIARRQGGWSLKCLRDKRKENPCLGYNGKSLVCCFVCVSVWVFVSLGIYYAA